jgi:hypothetical protein
MITDVKCWRIMDSAYRYSIIIMIMELMSLTVPVLTKGNCAACCQQETDAMFLRM